MRFSLVVGWIVVFALFSGCAGRHGRRVTVYTSAEPPIPYVEVIPSSPGPESIWVDGYWHWDGSEHVWLRGHWTRPPARGYVWVRSGWERQGGHYHLIPGRWCRSDRRPTIHYHRPHGPPVFGPTYKTRPGLGRRRGG